MTETATDLAPLGCKCGAVIKCHDGSQWTASITATARPGRIVFYVVIPKRTPREGIREVLVTTPFTEHTWAFACGVTDRAAAMTLMMDPETGGVTDGN